MTRNKYTYPSSKLLLKSIVVKTSDFISESGTHFSSYLNKILEDKGLHQEISFYGNIILSSIMEDKRVFGLSIEKYICLIKKLNPEYYLTPDAETYIDEISLSKFELERIKRDTKLLVKRCTNSKPIGLVKGCNIEQVIMHSQFLSDIGIDIQVFHFGDYYRQSIKKEKLYALNLAIEIRKIAKVLLIYGIGSKKNINKFQFADEFITHSHFMYLLKENEKINIWKKFNKIRISVESLNDINQQKLR